MKHNIGDIATISFTSDGIPDVGIIADIMRIKTKTGVHLVGDGLYYAVRVGDNAHTYTINEDNVIHSFNFDRVIQEMMEI